MERTRQWRRDQRDLVIKRRLRVEASNYSDYPTKNNPIKILALLKSDCNECEHRILCMVKIPVTCPKLYLRDSGRFAKRPPNAKCTCAMCCHTAFHKRRKRKRDRMKFRSRELEKELKNV